jgi:uncharacterized protein YifE (UPF0438 family)
VSGRQEFLFAFRLICFTHQKGEVLLRANVEAVERVEAELDAFINKRSREREEANREEEAWKESTRRVNETRRRANRCAWIDHHGHMNLLHLGLAAEHADKRLRLMLETGHTEEANEGEVAS